MLEDIKDIRKKRKALDLTQTQLARMAGVSQSLMAKLERGSVDVSYSKARAIFEALESMERKEQLTAKDLMSKEIASVGPGDTVSKASERMKGIYSQLPVLSKGVCIGNISEQTILKAMQSGWEPKALGKAKVEEIMDEAFPTVLPKATLGEITALLQNNHAMMVCETGKIIGIITKGDLLKTMKR